MEQISDGGPAFACAAENGHQEGMSLRIWLAGMAMNGICSSMNDLKDDVTFMDVAKESFLVADAMLKQMEAR